MQRLFRSLILVGAAAATIQNAAVARAPDPPRPVETLADGNLRDPAPTVAELKIFAATARRNMVAMPAGTFEMGDWGPEVNPGGLPFDGPDSKPLHKVELDAFSISKFPVTYAEFDIFTAAIRLPRINQSPYIGKIRKPKNPSSATWEGAREYCRWLGRLIGAPVDLPTEAQWEYAARSGGKRARYPTDNGEYEPGRNLPSYEQKEAAGGLVEVDSLPPNPAGIYYMSAGVREWVADWYDPDYYQHSPVKNPAGPSTGTEHVVRGNFGDGGSEMSFKRWSERRDEQVGTWSKYDEQSGRKILEIPHTKYSTSGEPAFRCARN